MATVAIVSEIIWRRREILGEIINECLSGGIGEVEHAWLMLTVAEWTKDSKYVDYAIMHLSEMRYAREDVKSKASSLVEEIRRLKDAKEFYGKLANEARRAFYDLLEKCVSEKLPF